MGNVINKNNKIVKPQNERVYMLGIIDPQNDFFKGGSLEVKNAEETIGPINKLRFLCNNYMDTFISQDYHPTDHMSFASTYDEKIFTKKSLKLEMSNKDVINVEQTLWPDHCVAHTTGKNFHKDIIVLAEDKIFRKGKLQNVESYSAFGDAYFGKYENTKLREWLYSNEVTDIVIVGIATDYCVYNTILDAIYYGFSVHLILSCTRGVDPITTMEALVHVKKLGIKIYEDVDDFYKYLRTIKNSII